MDGGIARSVRRLGNDRGRESEKREPEEKARLFASDKPAHRSLPRPFSTAFGFSLGRKPSGSLLPDIFYDSQCGNCLPQIHRTNPDPIARDFNMNCLLMATCPRGRTARRYLELSVRRRRCLHDVAMSRNGLVDH